MRLAAARPLIACAVALVAAACGPGTPANVTYSGTLIYLERIALPPGAVVTAELRDVARADAPSTLLASESIAATEGPPFSFSLSVPTASIPAQASLAISGTIRDGDRLMFITDTRNTVPPEGASGLEIRLTMVAQAPAEPPAPPAVPGVAPTGPASYRCGEDVFGVAFEPEVAYVTVMADMTLVTLNRLPPADPAAPEIFTNGALTFTRDATGAIQFARGRMAFTPCETVP